MRKLLFIVNLACFAVHAQHSSELGRFSIDYSKGCAPVTVFITATDTFGNAARTYFYEEGLIETTDTFYTYTEPGTYKIVQFPAIDVVPKTDTLVFEVLPPTPPQFNIFQCSATEVQVEITDEVYDYYVVKFTNTDSVIYTPPQPLPAYDYGQPSGNVQVTGYYNDSYPTCGDTFKAFNTSTVTDATLLSASILQGCRNDFFLNLETETDPFTRYQVEISQGHQDYEQVYEGSIVQTKTTYPVAFDITETSWCVRINTINPCTGVITTGESTCQTIDPATFSPLTNAYTSYRNQNILIHISPTSGNEVLLFRRSGNSTNYAHLTTISEAYTDHIPSLSRSFEYKLVQQDTCGNKIDSVLLRPPFIRLIDKNRHENTVTISSEDPKNELGSYDKSLIIYNPDSSVVTEHPYDPVIHLPPEVGSTQRIRTCYRYTDAGIHLFSNELITDYETTIFLPRAFTPNGDLLNDKLELFGLPTNEFEISIFNRWGELIHQSVNTNPVWDGRINQEPAPGGTYRYRLNFKLTNGEVKSQVGTFVLFKK